MTHLEWLHRERRRWWMEFFEIAAGLLLFGFSVGVILTFCLAIDQWVKI